MPTSIREGTLSGRQLLNVARSGRARDGVGRMRALAALQLDVRPSVDRVLSQIAGRASEEPRFRHLAALGLYRRGGARADRALATAARRADKSTAPTIAMGLGRVGGRNRLATTIRLAALSPPRKRPGAEFAATLLAYRHGLDGREVRSPGGRAWQTLGRGRADPIDVQKTPAAEARSALAALDVDPLDVDLTAKGAQTIQCGDNNFVWLWTDGTAARGVADVLRTKAVAGVLMRKRRFGAGYALSAIGLATPRRGGARLTLHRSKSGKIMYSGLIDRQGAFSLQSRNHPGASAIEFRASVGPGRLDVARARSAVIAVKAKAPKRG